jgi:uncharacterized protein
VKSSFSITLALALLAAALVNQARGADEPSSGKIRVLLTYGGHNFEEPLFFAIFDAMPGIAYTKVKMPQAAELLKPGLEKQYDVVVMYDMVPHITPEHQKALVDLLNTGIGVVSLHHNLLAYNLPGQGSWEEYHKILGGQYLFKELTADGKKFGPSSYALDQHMHITVANHQHPITAGVNDFNVFDESYGNYYIAPGVTILLTTDYPKNNPALAWATQYGKSRVFYLQLGHGPGAWQNPNYSRLVSNGIRWAAGK